MKDEKSVLTNSIMNIPTMFDIDNLKNEKREIILEPDDLIIKLLNYVEFWKQKKALKNNIIFLLQIFGYFIKENPILLFNLRRIISERSENDEKKVEIQVISLIYMYKKKNMKIQKGFLLNIQISSKYQIIFRICLTD